MERWKSGAQNNQKAESRIAYRSIRRSIKAITPNNTNVY